MIDPIKPENLLLLDIETVPASPRYEELDDRARELWEKKSRSLRSGQETAEELYEKAGLFAEFGKVVCITVAFFHGEEGERQLRITSFCDEDERGVLEGFAELLKRSFKGKDRYLCAHNGKEFDFPYLARRMLILGIDLPDPLKIAGKKPWEVPHLDTMELWGFGDRRNSTSLDLLAYVLGIPTPKDDIDGSEVGWVFWEEGDLDRIRTYCEKDVLTLAQLILRFRNEAFIPDDRIEVVT